MGDRYRRSRELLEKTSRFVPLASQTFSKSPIQYPSAAPHFLARGQGSRVWDVDGNVYIDFINGLLPVILGYCDPDVDRAVLDQLGKGVSFSLPTSLEGELAEILVEIIPCAEMVRFGKNGSDATAGAVRVARAYTGRDRVAVCGYHGWQDWYIGSTARNRGVPRCVVELTHPFQYNDLSSLRELFDRYPGEFAAVIMEPMNLEEPAAGFLEGVQNLAHSNGAVLIFDEIITGFRFALGGAQELFGVIPDLAAIGKSMANGFPISAVVGKKELMKEMEEIFFSFTFGGEAVSLAAALATIKKMREKAVIRDLWEKGERVMKGVSERIRGHRLEGVFGVKGKPPWSLLVTGDHEKASSWEIKSLFKQEMLLRGILISASHNMSYAHTGEDVEKLLAAYDEVLGEIRDALQQDALRRRLVGLPIEPIFKVR
ncbi:MAG: aminotransferase class III-fold pyridoxal phosphate-dependent enzyme [Deltaproteobacteria bacterium]|nr:aminotransferase class III-fold pyridoxal phosphate-dependent enzyme [Deltaproteobacteria bacterium]